jgi:histidine triad (HIT) family protein
MTADCIFCRISSGRLRADIIWQDDLIIALADLCPIRRGHALIIPRAHHPYFDDLPELTASRIIHLGQRLARVMKPLLTATRVAFLFTGGDHPHVHALAGTP